jgi:transcriptional regulator with XRE-family HTH domain
MPNQKLVEAVGKYIDKYYIPADDDITLDSEMKSIFDRISEFRQQRKVEKQIQMECDEVEIDEQASDSFDIGSMQKMKHTQTMSSTMATTRKIDDLMNQMEETFSQRLLRMIDERGMTDSEVYSRAHVDRRHFSKIRKDVNYNPNKKTVLAFSIALELSLDETKDLLNSAGFALSRSSKTDIIVAYFLQNKIYDMFEINDILDAYEQPIFE